jgi:hypothetical protein
LKKWWGRKEGSCCCSTEVSGSAGKREIEMEWMKRERRQTGLGTRGLSLTGDWTAKGLKEEDREMNLGRNRVKKIMGEEKVKRRKG